jgi:hypothetical protein
MSEAVSQFMRKVEHEVIPLFRKQKGRMLKYGQQYVDKGAEDYERSHQPLHEPISQEVTGERLSGGSRLGYDFLS